MCDFFKTLHVVFFHKTQAQKKISTFITLEHHGGEKSDCFCEDDDDDIIIITVIIENEDEEHRYRRIVGKVFLFFRLRANNAAALAQQ